jgi:hypothetical protein
MVLTKAVAAAQSVAGLELTPSLFWWPAMETLGQTCAPGAAAIPYRATPTLVAPERAGGCAPSYENGDRRLSVEAQRNPPKVGWIHIRAGERNPSERLPAR